MREILRIPFFYDLYITLIGGKKFFSGYVREYLKPLSRQSVLELGSGCGNITPYLPKDIDYTGFDFSQNCVDYSKKRFPERNFICQDISKDYPVYTNFDIIFSEGVMASMSDEQITGMLENIVKHADENTKIVLSDMNYCEENTFWQNFFLKKERGHNLRGKDDFIKLFEKYLDIKEIIPVRDAFIIPNSKIVFICSKKQ